MSDQFKKTNNPRFNEGNEEVRTVGERNVPSPPPDFELTFHSPRGSLSLNRAGPSTEAGGRGRKYKRDMAFLESLDVATILDSESNLKEHLVTELRIRKINLHHPYLRSLVKKARELQRVALFQCRFDRVVTGVKSMPMIREENESEVESSSSKSDIKVKLHGPRDGHGDQGGNCC